MDQADAGDSEKDTQPSIVERLQNVGCDREPFTPEHAKCICRLVNEAANEIESLREQLNDDPTKWSFNTLLEVGRRLLAEHYPESVFSGASGDEGPQYVAALRDRLRALATPEGRDEIAVLKELLHHADEKVIWEHTQARSGFQEEIEAALGIGANRLPTPKPEPGGDDIALAKAAALSNTDDREPYHVLLATLGCALSHEKASRILGNVRAGDLARSLYAALSALPRSIPDQSAGSAPAHVEKVTSAKGDK